MKVLTRNETQINRETAQESLALNLFQPFTSELLKNKYSEDITVATLRSLIYKGDIVGFLKKQALLKTPEVNNLPITEEAKFNMIDVTKVFSNYFQITSLHATLPKDEKIIRLIYSYTLSEAGELSLSPEAIERIENAFSVKADENEAKIFNRLSVILEELEGYKKNNGYNIFKAGAIINTESGGWGINVDVLLYSLRNK